MTIFIDPGHGGHDPGAVGPTGLKESDVVLDVARRVREMMHDSGHIVRMTRDVDIFVDLPGRATFANKLEAHLFVSIHCNASANVSAHGTETWHYPGSAQGERLARCLQEALLVRLGRRDRGLKQSSSLSVLRRTSMPAALVELAFISNPVEEALLGSDEGRTAAALGIMEGIMRWVKAR